MSGALEHELLRACGARHGFGLRGTQAPPGTLRPKQVHGSAVARVRDGSERLGEADAAVCSAPGVAVAVVTADCVPILLAAPGARIVAAVHAGWRGLAAGVIEAALVALAAAGAAHGELVAAIGPHVGPCCYEVDEPVLARSARASGTLSTRRRARRVRVTRASISAPSPARTCCGRSRRPRWARFRVPALAATPRASSPTAGMARAPGAWCIGCIAGVDTASSVKVG